MKISVYEIETVKPQDENEYNDICDILNLPSLKYGTAEFIGNFSHYINKGELKKIKLTYSKFYDRNAKDWKEGLLIAINGKKMFAEYI